MTSVSVAQPAPPPAFPYSYGLFGGPTLGDGGGGADAAALNLILSAKAAPHPADLAAVYNPALMHSLLGRRFNGSISSTAPHDLAPCGGYLNGPYLGGGASHAAAAPAPHGGFHWSLSHGANVPTALPLVHRTKGLAAIAPAPTAGALPAGAATAAASLWTLPELPPPTVAVGRAAVPPTGPHGDHLDALIDDTISFDDGGFDDDAFVSVLNLVNEAEAF
jgi:hypothetical protein